MPRTYADARRWVRDGTSTLLKAADISREQLDAPSALPEWTRRRILAHVAANADALGNLVHWAATGQPTPMYASPDARAMGIEDGSRLPDRDLLDSLVRSAESLERAMSALSTEQWRRLVTTAQGRRVPATEVPWLRAREVWVHAVDLATELTFADLPPDFLNALCDDVIEKRRGASGPAVLLETPDDDRWELPGESEALRLVGPIDQIAAYLTGRDHRLTTVAGGIAPQLPAWL